MRDQSSDSGASLLNDDRRLTADELASKLAQVREWHLVKRDGIARIERVFLFPNFAQAMAFAVRVGQEAEEAGHHPAILTEWGRVTVTWWTHRIKGLHRSDFVMASKTDKLYAPGGP
jgi:4a-hydroxytetrahydrobiopterin dehydratase